MPSSTVERRVAQVRAGRTRRLQALGNAIREARIALGLSQADVGALVGSPKIPQTTISRWEGGLVELSGEQLLLLEITLDLPIGTLSRTVGYYSPEGEREVSSVSILMDMGEDPAMHPSFQDLAIASYRGFLEASSALVAQTPKKTAAKRAPAKTPAKR